MLARTLDLEQSGMTRNRRSIRRLERLSQQIVKFQVRGDART